MLWYDDDSYDSEYLTEIGPPQSETSTYAVWLEDFEGQTGGAFGAQLWPNGYNYDGYFVWEYIYGWFDWCKYSHPEGPQAQPPLEMSDWPVAGGGQYGPDYITTPHDWANWYLYRIVTQQWDPCSCTCYQDMYITSDAQGDFYFVTNWTENYLYYDGMGAAFRGNASVWGDAYYP
jgi:hypothetical protein